MSCLINYNGTSYTEKAFLDYVTNHLDQFSDHIFLQNKSQHENTTPSAAGKDTLKKVHRFLEDIGVDVQKVSKLSVNGRFIDGNALSNITRSLIQVVEGKEDTALPEEAMHFGVELLEQKNPVLFNQMMREISRYKIFGQILTQYRTDPHYRLNGKPDIIKIKKEAIARVLVETIIRQNEGSTERPELLAKAAGWWQQVLDFFKQLFNRANYNPFLTTTEKFLAGKLATTDTELKNNSAFFANRASRVNASLKLVSALRDPAIAAAYERFITSNPEKFMSELGKTVPANQVAAFRKFIDPNDHRSLDEVLTDVLSSLVYAVDIQPSTIASNGAQQKYGNFTFHGIMYGKLYDGVYFKKQQAAENVTFIQGDEYETAYQQAILESVPTHHHIDYTVDGGYNYRENEIRTPEIKAGIPGHASFSTDKGIGWFRTDDASDDIKTRRVLELQSDLFQLGRNRSILAADDNKPASHLANQNLFLGLLNENNNWVRFFIKAIIQDSAAKGYQKIRFPQGHTALDIQKESAPEEDISQLETALNNIDDYYVMEDYYDEDFDQAVKKGTYYFSWKVPLMGKNRESFVSEIENGLDYLRNNSIDITRPNFSFYDNRVKNSLDKIYGKAGVSTIEDDSKHKWYQIDIDPSRDLDEFYFQLNQPSHQQRLSDQLLSMHGQLSKKSDPGNAADNAYYIAGRKIANRVTNLTSKYYRSKFQRQQISETALQQALNDQKREKGQDGHSDLESIFHHMVDDNGFLRDQEQVQTQPSQLDPTDNSFYKILEGNLRERLHSFKAGTRFFSELMVYDENKDEAGTIDFLAIEPDQGDKPGKIHILDWKFINLKDTQTDIPWYKKEAWNIQLSEYMRILTSPYYGSSKEDFGLNRVIPIRARYKFTDGQTKIKLVAVEIGNANVKAVSDDTLLPVPAASESTGNKHLDELITSLKRLTDKILDKPADPGQEYQRTERIADLVSAIRRLQVKQETKKLFNFALADIRKYNLFFRKYFDLVSGQDHQALSNLDANNLAREILEADDALNLYREFNKIFRKISDPNDPENKPLLQEAEKISDNADVVKSKLLDLAGAIRINVIARGANVEDLLEPEKVVSWYQKWVRSLSQASTKATEILWNIVHAVSTKIQFEFSDEVSKLKEMESTVSSWIKSTGRTFKDLEKMIFAFDSKGRWNGKMISKISASFYGEISQALIGKNSKWVLDNIDKDAYNQWYYQEFQERKNNYATSRLSEDEITDEDLKTKRLLLFEKQFDINKFPETAFSIANNRLKYFPDISKWTSVQYKQLQQPGNESVLDLYNYWTEKLDKSYRLGMIKSWERNTFFPNVRKDFLDKIVFGTGEQKTANLGFLDQLRVNSNDEVFGYTDINGNPQDRLFALYSHDLGQKVTDEDGSEFTDYSNKSTDIFKVMALWNKEMLKYEHKSQVVDLVQLLHFTEKNRKAISRSKSTGAIQRRTDGEPVLVDNIENSEYFKNFMDYYFYGKKLSEGGDVTFAFKYNALAEKVNKFFGKDILPQSSEEEVTISGKKAIGAVNRFFQMKTLGLNLATAVTNYLGGTANAYMLSGKYFTKSDYTKASLLLSSAKFHTETGRRYAALLNYFLPLTEDRTRHQIQGLSVSKAVKLLSSDHLFYLMRSSDKMVQYPAAIAFFDNTMVSEGKLVNIREHVKAIHNYDNIYKLTATGQKDLRNTIEKEITELKDTKSLSKIVTISADKASIEGISRNSQTVMDLRNRIQQFSKDALGNMSEDDISQYRMTLLGQSFMMFKNWIPRMADVRFGELRYQAGTDSYEWGRVSMLFNALKHGILQSSAAMLGTLVGSDSSMIALAQKIYKEKKTQKQALGERFDISEAAFVDMYIKGIRAQIKEVGLMLSMVAMLLFAKAHVPDPDEDSRSSGAYKYLVRMIDKMTDELGFFYNPLSFTAIANGSVFPSVQILNDIVKLIASMNMESYYLIIGDQKAKEKNKVLKYLFKIFPVTKEMMMYTAIFNDDLAKEYGLRITTNARRNY